MAEVTIRKRYRKDGEVMYEYRFEIATIDGKRQWKTKCGFKTIGEARREGKVALQLYEQAGQIVTKDRISVADFYDYWLENDCLLELKPTTTRNYKNIVEKLIKPRLGTYRLKSLTREILQAFFIELYDKGFSYNSLISIKGVLTKSMNYALDNHYIVTSPAVRLKIPKNKAPKIPTRKAPHYYIKKEYMDEIFKRFPENTPSHVPLKLGYECGLRLGEVFALCWEDVDFENNVIYINRQVQWYQDENRDAIDKIKNNGSSDCGNGFWYFSPPKYNSYRKIEISDELAGLLQREKVRQSRAMDYYGVFYMNYYTEHALTFNAYEPRQPDFINKISTDSNGYPIHLICIRDNGTFISPRTMQHVSRIVKKEITTEFDFHSLRKTHASMLAEMGVEQKYIQTRLGHADLDMTIDVYECTTDIMRERGRSALNKLFR